MSIPCTDLSDGRLIHIIINIVDSFDPANPRLKLVGIIKETVEKANCILPEKGSAGYQRLKALVTDVWNHFPPPNASSEEINIWRDYKAAHPLIQKKASLEEEEEEEEEKEDEEEEEEKKSPLIPTVMTPAPTVPITAPRSPVPSTLAISRTPSTSIPKPITNEQIKEIMESILNAQNIGTITINDLINNIEDKLKRTFTPTEKNKYKPVIMDTYIKIKNNLAKLKQQVSASAASQVTHPVVIPTTKQIQPGRTMPKEFQGLTNDQLKEIIDNARNCAKNKELIALLSKNKIPRINDIPIAKYTKEQLCELVFNSITGETLPPEEERIDLSDCNARINNKEKLLKYIKSRGWEEPAKRATKKDICDYIERKLRDEGQTPKQIEAAKELKSMELIEQANSPRALVESQQPSAITPCAVNREEWKTREDVINDLKCPTGTACNIDNQQCIPQEENIPTNFKSIKLNLGNNTIVDIYGRPEHVTAFEANVKKIISVPVTRRFRKLAVEPSTTPVTAPKPSVKTCATLTEGTEEELAKDLECGDDNICDLEKKECVSLSSLGSDLSKLTYKGREIIGSTANINELRNELKEKIQPSSKIEFKHCMVRIKPDNKLIAVNDISDEILKNKAITEIVCDITELNAVNPPVIDGNITGFIQLGIPLLGTWKITNVRSMGNNQYQILISQPVTSRDQLTKQFAELNITLPKPTIQSTVQSTVQTTIQPTLQSVTQSTVQPTISQIPLSRNRLVSARESILAYTPEQQQKGNESLIKLQQLTGATIPSSKKTVRFNIPSRSIQPTIQPTEQVIEQPTEQVIEQSTEQVIRQSTEQVIKQPTEQVTEQPTERPTVLPTLRPTEQSTRRPVRVIQGQESQIAYLSQRIKEISKESHPTPVRLIRAEERLSNEIATCIGLVS